MINKIFPITALGYLFHTQYDMGMKYFSDGQFDRALETFESALLTKAHEKTPRNRNAAEAQYGAALCYLSGLGVEKRDVPKAMDYLQEIVNDKRLGELNTAEMNNVRFLLGLIYLDAACRDEKKAEVALNTAAEGNHALAQYTLGVYYRKQAERLMQDNEDSNEAEHKAIQWLEKASHHTNLSEKNRIRAQQLLDELIITN